MATRLLTLWQRADAELQSMLGDIRTRVTGFDALFCWGQNGEGQLGNGTTVSSAVPVGSRHGSASAKSPAALTMRVP
jgi:hypothetical protein